MNIIQKDVYKVAGKGEGNNQNTNSIKIANLQNRNCIL